MNGKVFVCAWMVTFAAASVTLGLDVDAEDRKGNELDAIAEDIEVMQRLLGKALSRHYGAKADAGEETVLGSLPQFGRFSDARKSQGDEDHLLAWYHSLAASNFSIARQTKTFAVAGYYVPGSGAFFTLSLPASVTEADPSPEQDKVKDDLWSQTEGEVRGTNRHYAWIHGAEPTKTVVLDEGALNETVDVLLEAVAKYGSRIEGLSAGDSIVLAARVQPEGARAWANATLFAAYAAPCGTVAGPGSYRVIIQIPVSAVRDFSNDKIDLNTLRQRSEITRYQVCSGLYGTRRAR